ERWLDLGVTAAALDGGQHAGLLAADVRAGAAHHSDLQVEPGAEDALADEAFFLGGLHGGLEALVAEDELAAQVDERVVALDGPAGKDDALEQLVRIALEDVAVLVRAGLDIGRASWRDHGRVS